MYKFYGATGGLAKEKESIMDKYHKWLVNCKKEKELYDELIDIKENEKEIADRFYRDLTFGMVANIGNYESIFPYIEKTFVNKMLSIYKKGFGKSEKEKY